MYDSWGIRMSQSSDREKMIQQQKAIAQHARHARYRHDVLAHIPGVPVEVHRDGAAGVDFHRDLRERHNGPEVCGLAADGAEGVFHAPAFQVAPVDAPAGFVEDVLCCRCIRIG